MVAQSGFYEIKTYALRLLILSFYLEEYIAAGTSDELQKIQDVLQTESDWLEEDSWGETLEVGECF